MPVNDIQVLCQLCVWRFKSNGVSATPVEASNQLHGCLSEMLAIS